MRGMSVLSFLLVLSLAGCGLVESDHPLSAPEDSVLDERLVGIWEPAPTDPEEAKEPKPRLYVGRHAEEANTLEVVLVELDGDGHLQVKRRRAWGTQLGTMRCISLEGESTGTYVFVRYELEDDGRLFIQLLDAKKVAEAVRQERIAGRVPEGDDGKPVRLTAPTKELRAWLENASGVWYERTEDATPLRKLEID